MKKSPFIISVIGTLFLVLSLGISNVLMAQDSEPPVVCPIACGYIIDELDNILVPADSSLNPYECLSISRDRFMDGFPARERGRVINELDLNDKDGKARGAQVIFSKPPGFD